MSGQWGSPTQSSQTVTSPHRSPHRARSEDTWSRYYPVAVRSPPPVGSPLSPQSPVMTRRRRRTGSAFPSHRRPHTRIVSQDQLFRKRRSPSSNPKSSYSYGPRPQRPIGSATTARVAKGMYLLPTASRRSKTLRPVQSSPLGSGPPPPISTTDGIFMSPTHANSTMNVTPSASTLRSPGGVASPSRSRFGFRSNLELMNAFLDHLEDDMPHMTTHTTVKSAKTTTKKPKKPRTIPKEASTDKTLYLPFSWSPVAGSAVSPRAPSGREVPAATTVVGADSKNGLLYSDAAITPRGSEPLLHAASSTLPASTAVSRPAHRSAAQLGTGDAFSHVRPTPTRSLGSLPGTLSSPSRTNITSVVLSRVGFITSPPPYHSRPPPEPEALSSQPTRSLPSVSVLPEVRSPPPPANQPQASGAGPTDRDMYEWFMSLTDGLSEEEQAALKERLAHMKVHLSGGEDTDSVPSAKDASSDKPAADTLPDIHEHRLAAEAAREEAAAASEKLAKMNAEMDALRTQLSDVLQSLAQSKEAEVEVRGVAQKHKDAMAAQRSELERVKGDLRTMEEQHLAALARQKQAQDELDKQRMEAKKKFERRSSVMSLFSAASMVNFSKKVAGKRRPRRRKSGFFEHEVPDPEDEAKLSSPVPGPVSMSPLEAQRQLKRSEYSNQARQLEEEAARKRMEALARSASSSQTEAKQRTSEEKKLPAAERPLFHGAERKEKNVNEWGDVIEEEKSSSEGEPEVEEKFPVASPAEQAERLRDIEMFEDEAMTKGKEEFRSILLGGGGVRVSGAGSGVPSAQGTAVVAPAANLMQRTKRSSILVTHRSRRGAVMVKSVNLSLWDEARLPSIYEEIGSPRSPSTQQNPVVVSKYTNKDGALPLPGSDSSGRDLVPTLPPEVLDWNSGLKGSELLQVNNTLYMQAVSLKRSEDEFDDVYRRYLLCLHPPCFQQYIRYVEEMAERKQTRSSHARTLSYLEFVLSLDRPDVRRRSHHSQTSSSWEEKREYVKKMWYSKGDDTTLFTQLSPMSIIVGRYFRYGSNLVHQRVLRSYFRRVKMSYVSSRREKCSEPMKASKKKLVDRLRRITEGCLGADRKLVRQAVRAGRQWEARNPFRKRDPKSKGKYVNLDVFDALSDLWTMLITGERTRPAGKLRPKEILLHLQFFQTELQSMTGFVYNAPSFPRDSLQAKDNVLKLFVDITCAGSNLKSGIFKPTTHFEILRSRQHIKEVVCRSNSVHKSRNPRFLPQLVSLRDLCHYQMDREMLFRCYAESKMSDDRTLIGEFAANLYVLQTHIGASFPLVNMERLSYADKEALKGSLQLVSPEEGQDGDSSESSADDEADPAQGDDSREHADGGEPLVELSESRDGRDGARSPEIRITAALPDSLRATSLASGTDAADPALPQPYHTDAELQLPGLSASPPSRSHSISRGASFLSELGGSDTEAGAEYDPLSSLLAPPAPPPAPPRSLISAMTAEENVAGARGLPTSPEKSPPTRPVFRRASSLGRGRLIPGRARANTTSGPPSGRVTSSVSPLSRPAEKKRSGGSGAAGKGRLDRLDLAVSGGRQVSPRKRSVNRPTPVRGRARSVFDPSSAGARPRAGSMRRISQSPPGPTVKSSFGSGISYKSTSRFGSTEGDEAGVSRARRPSRSVAKLHRDRGSILGGPGSVFSSPRRPSHVRSPTDSFARKISSKSPEDARSKRPTVNSRSKSGSGPKRKSPSPAGAGLSPRLQPDPLDLMQSSPSANTIDPEKGSLSPRLLISPVHGLVENSRNASPTSSAAVSPSMGPRSLGDRDASESFVEGPPAAMIPRSNTATPQPPDRSMDPPSLPPPNPEYQQAISRVMDASPGFLRFKAVDMCVETTGSYLCYPSPVTSPFTFSRDEMLRVQAGPGVTPASKSSGGGRAVNPGRRDSLSGAEKLMDEAGLLPKLVVAPPPMSACLLRVRLSAQNLYYKSWFGSKPDPYVRVYRSVYRFPVTLPPSALTEAIEAAEEKVRKGGVRSAGHHRNTSIFFPSYSNYRHLDVREEAKRRAAKVKKGKGSKPNTPAGKDRAKSAGKSDRKDPGWDSSDFLCVRKSRASVAAGGGWTVDPVGAPEPRDPYAYRKRMEREQKKKSGQAESKSMGASATEDVQEDEYMTGRPEGYFWFHSTPVFTWQNCHQTKNPQWATVNLRLYDVCYGDLDTPLLFRVFHKDSMMSQTVTTVRLLLESQRKQGIPLYHPQTVAKDGPKGELLAQASIYSHLNDLPKLAAAAGIFRRRMAPAERRRRADDLFVGMHRLRKMCGGYFLRSFRRQQLSLSKQALLTFCMGMHPSLGARSPIYRSLVSDPLFTPDLLTRLSEFLGDD